MRNFINGLGSLFWSGVTLLIILAVMVLVLRVVRAKVPGAATAVNFTARNTGLGV